MATIRPVDEGHGVALHGRSAEIKKVKRDASLKGRAVEDGRSMVARVIDMVLGGITSAISGVGLLDGLVVSGEATAP